MRAKQIQTTTLVAGIVVLLSSVLSLQIESNILNAVRIATGLFFIMTMGLPYVRLIRRQNEELTGADCILSVGMSLLLTYPSGLINIIIEGKTNIYVSHLPGFLAASLGLFIIGLIISKFLVYEDQMIKISRKDIVPICSILLVGFVLRVANLGAASINGDEMDLSVQSYDLVDGMVAGRNAYFISGTGHSPLGFFISHAIYNIFEPGGFYSMSLWMIRIPQVIMGMLVIWGTFILSKNFIGKSNRVLTFLPPLIVAIDSYSNFGSRLAIFQDVSTYTFFVIIFVLLLADFLKNKTWINSISLGVSLGMILLVKMSGIFLIPIMLGLIIIYRQEWKKIIGSLTTALFVFTPVIIYNIGAYITMGYMDVPMAKLANIIGIPAKSIMNTGGDDSIYEGIRSPIMTFVEMQFMLLDQWGIALSIFFVISILSGLVYMWKNKQHIQQAMILHSVIILSIIFFSINGFRTYYLAYLTVFIAVIVGMDLSNIKRYKQAIVAAAILVVPFTLLYNINTNILLEEPEAVSEYGRSGMAEFAPTYHSQLATPFSYGSAAFLSDGGWDELTEELNNVGAKELVLDNSLNVLSIKWYLHINDEIRMFHQDPNYIEKYAYTYLSDWDGIVNDGMALISLSEREYRFQHDEIIRDSHGNIEFYVYWTE